jgi:hypothetical protein
MQEAALRKRGLPLLPHSNRASSPAPLDGGRRFGLAETRGAVALRRGCLLDSTKAGLQFEVPRLAVAGVLSSRKTERQFSAAGVASPAPVT